MKREHEIEKSIPEEYEMVQYIKNPGAQYLNPNIVFNWNEDIEIHATVLKSTAYDRMCVLGGYNDQYVKELNIEFSNDNKLRIWINKGSIDSKTPKTVKVGELMDVDFTYTASNGAFSCTTLASDNTPTSVNGTYKQTGNSASINIFTDTRTGYNMPFKNLCISEIAISNGNEWHFVACKRKSDNKPGMYDLYGGGFYTNAGTGELQYA